MAELSFHTYQNYQTEDFVMDEAFQQWVRHPDPVSDQFWQRFLVAHPDQRETVEEAHELVRNIRYRPYTLSPTRQQQILEAAYDQAAKSQWTSGQLRSPTFSRKYRAAAAAISLLLFSTLAYWLLQPSYDTYHTGYQENQTIQLADGTEVTLNANTRLSVKMDTAANQPREVWLEGEAYFHVKRLEEPEAKKTPQRKNFVVHTGNFDIEVLGTTFNVASRSEESEVLLKSGKVLVASPQIAQTQVLQPGDRLTLSEEDKTFRLKKTERDTDLAWRDNFFFFENTPLYQVARALEDYYGLEIIIIDPALAHKIFTAKVSRDQLPMLLEAIEASFGVTITREADTIKIHP